VNPAWPWPLAHPDAYRILSTLLKVLRGIPVTGWEASCKFGPQGMLPGRLLTGFSPRGVSRRYLEGLPRHLGMPEEIARIFAGEWSRCSRILLGYESGITDTILKVYLEYPLPAAGKTRQACLAIRGFKWKPDDGVADWHEARYWCLSGLTPSEARKRLLESMPKQAEWIVLQTWLAEALEQACRKAGNWPHFQIMNSRDATSPRNTINLRFYDSGLTVHGLSQGVRQLGSDWGLPAAETERFLMATRNREIGWLQAGIGVDQHPFLTLYCAATRADARMALLNADDSTG